MVQPAGGGSVCRFSVYMPRVASVNVPLPRRASRDPVSTRPDRRPLRQGRKVRSRSDDDHGTIARGPIGVRCRTDYPTRAPAVVRASPPRPPGFRTTGRRDHRHLPCLESLSRIVSFVNRVQSLGKLAARNSIQNHLFHGRQHSAPWPPAFRISALAHFPWCDRQSLGKEDEM
jgi:hypothetical protein